MSLTLKDAFQSSLSATANTAGYNTASAPDILVTISGIITIVLSLVGIVFIAFMIYAGYTWMMAGGVEEKYKRAKTVIRESLIGLVVTLGAYAISYFVLNYIGQSALK